MREVAPPPTANVRSSVTNANRIRLDVLADLDAELHRAQFCFGRRAFGDDLGFARIFNREIGGLHQQSAKHALEVESSRWIASG